MLGQGGREHHENMGWGGTGKGHRSISTCNHMAMKCAWGKKGLIDPPLVGHAKKLTGMVVQQGKFPSDCMLWSLFFWLRYVPGTGRGRPREGEKTNARRAQRTAVGFSSLI